MKRQEEKTIIEEPESGRVTNSLEVITVRVAQEDELENALRFCTQVFHTIDSGGLMDLCVYRSTGYESDLSVHVRKAREAFSQEKSLLGLQLAKGLSAFGIVSHTLWIDQQIDVGSDT